MGAQPALILLVLAAICATINAIPTISAVGSKFFTSDGNQFFIKGVAYQLVEDDPLVNTTQCKLDAALMQQLGANTIRVYHVDATADHSGCMNAFADVGIYLFVDMDSFKTYIRYESDSSWTANKSASYRAVMDNFQQYDNTAGFFVGNEVLNVLADSGAAPYLLSAAVDLKSYRDAKGYRKIPIGYSATDTAVLRPMLQDYLVCRPNVTERLDFYALNSYEWCGSTPDFQTSGYIGLQALAENYPVPIFLSEDGCNTVPPRTFDDQAAIFGPQMVDTWSGAIIYEWIQEMNAYGLVSYGPPVGPDVNVGSTIVQGFTRQGVPTPVSPDFSNLQQQWKTLNPTGVSSAPYAATVKTTPPTCPSSTAGGWTVDPSAPLPTIGVGAVSAGMPSGVPKGSITVASSAAGTPSPSTLLSVLTSSPLLSKSTSQTRSTYSSTVTPSISSKASSTTSGGASSATSEGAAGRTVSGPPSSKDAGIIGMALALVTVGAGVMLWL
ncbi:uncharacterized protein Z519_05339 [Cladophialophora bantiana CBS 173.52]|uniref:1,3-beta-glucanosyltransferase n=1 Tax=Cladophialophora bantiana (strain ATCC 10958 / CBS 173.52 / CDC B-1940 / NIH 8579) TaxID=1442370 RepID=A0A0D2HL92_CLAB1|nr:uncharacterized protein Z519_05339 [Cladophialophora bantiana CBS 173.52]KIW94023.1 hypothetical protein Z519_05339 [Cladophialophora bantiana CBS 173.52]